MEGEPFVLIDDGTAIEVTAVVDGNTVRLSPETVDVALGWELKPRGLCRGALCLPVGPDANLQNDAGIDLRRLAEVLGKPLALDVEEGAAYLGVSAADRGATLATLEAPDFRLPDLDGHHHALSDYRGRKILLVAYASWWGCRYDLPVWQEIHEELEAHGLTVVTVALDENVDEVRPFVEAAKPSHPSLIDREHLIADLYGIINVPTVVWIDEEGKIVRPNDVAFGNDAFKDFTGLDSAPHLNALRAWVKDGAAPFDAETARQRQMLPTADEQLARAEFGLALHLHRGGRSEAAERHFLRGGELSPNDFTVRRGSMPIRGIDPMGSPEFLALFEEWTNRGRPYYQPR